MLRKTVHASRRIFNQFTHSNWKKVSWYIREYGFSQFLAKAAEKVSFFASLNQEYSFDDVGAYKRWIAVNEPAGSVLAAQKSQKFKISPKVSIIVPTYNTPKAFLTPMIESVLQQTYANWELCIADGASSKAETRQFLDQLKGSDKRIKIEFLSANDGIAGNTNAALKLATGEFVTFLDHDDTLAPFALFEVVSTINAVPTADFIYSDEDKLSQGGQTRLKPHFKPDWSPDTICSYNYITHLMVIKRTLLDKVGHILNGFEGSQDFDLVLRATEKAKQIVHIPKVLYHWREHAGSTSSNTKSKSYAAYSTKKAVAAHLNRVKLAGRVVDGPFFGSARVLYNLPTPAPLVSIIIPTKDQAELLKSCVDSIVNNSSYPNYEIVLADTGSTEPATTALYAELKKNPKIKLIDWDVKPFNYSAVNNFAAKHAKGSQLLFLNNDIEVISSDWIEAMLEFAARSDVGAVGTKLLYPDATIQHAGVILGIGGVAGHSHKYYPGSSVGYFGRLVVPQNLSAVTAACVMIPKSVFEAVDGFDEGYPIAFNDIDLCLKIRSKGKAIIWTPHAQLYHYESKTRGYEDTPEKKARFAREIKRFQAKWGEVLKKGDPFYNPNLSLTREDFSLRVND